MRRSHYAVQVLVSLAQKVLISRSYRAPERKANRWHQMARKGMGWPVALATAVLLSDLVPHWFVSCCEVWPRVSLRKATIKLSKPHSSTVDTRSTTVVATNRFTRAT